jgi:hypothetical protein
LWEQAVLHDIPDQTIVFVVDATAFRPLVTVTDDGEVRCLKHLNHPTYQNIFTYFLKDPSAFTELLREYWEEAYSSMFVFHIQPIHPSLPCTVIHVYPIEHGTATLDTVATLSKRKTILETQFHFQIIGLAFLGDSCFNGLHDESAAQRRSILGPTPLSVPIRDFLNLCVIICDPRYLLKQIRYYLLTLLSFLSPYERIDFSIDRIQQAHFLSPGAFNNSKASKMHDSLRLELFSLKTLSYIPFPSNYVVGEVVIAS